jgi:uncharacterized surface protein with fasciclin (FAS1) repeats
MKKSMKITNTLLLTGVVFIASSCLKDFTEPTPTDGALKTITQVASGSDNFNILVAALKKTNLASFLDNNNAGDFTVFAPTDAAFVTYFNSLTAAQLPPGSAAPGTFDEASILAAINLVAAVYTPTNTTAMTPASLSSILLYHVVSSKITSALITGNQTFTSQNGNRLSISKDAVGVVLNANIASSAINGAKVTAVDAPATNGVIHTIDRVITFSSSNASPIAVFGLGINYAVSPIIISGGSETGGDATGTDYDILAYAIRIAGLAPALAPNISPLPDLTVFAPTDNAFRAYFGDTAPATKVLEDAAIQLVKALPTATLSDLLKYHVLPGRVLSTDLTSGQSVQTLLSGKSITVGISGSIFTLTDLNPAADPIISSANVFATTGLVHQINRVLRPN